MAKFQEIYPPRAIAANGTVTLGSGVYGVAGFICATAGNITVSDVNGTYITAMAVSAGVYYPMPMALNSGVVVLAGGAVGCLLIVQ